MKTIWKYELEPLSCEIEMPKGAEILSVQAQHCKACLWAKVDPAQPMEKRTFEVYGTGHSIDASREHRFISTFQMSEGYLVFHAFEVLKTK